MTQEQKVELQCCFAAGEILSRYDLHAGYGVEVMTPTDLHELRACFRFLDRHVGKFYDEDIEVFHSLQDIWMTTRDVLQKVMTEIGSGGESGAGDEDAEDQ